MMHATQNFTSGSNQIITHPSVKVRDPSEQNSQLILDPAAGGEKKTGFQPGRDLGAINLSLTLCPSLQESGSDL